MCLMQGISLLIGISRMDLMRERTSSRKNDSLVTKEERSEIFPWSSTFSFASSESCLMTLSSLVVMATMPETVAPSIDRIQPLPTVIVCKASGGMSLTKVRESCKLFLICGKISARKARGGKGPFVGEEEWGLGGR